jgi:hypothetical protein
MDEVDYEMQQAGAMPLLLTPGDYYHFRVGTDSIPKRAYGSNCACQEVRAYRFNGNRGDLEEFYLRLKKYYDYKIYLDIYGWDGWSVG